MRNTLLLFKQKSDILMRRCHSTKSLLNLTPQNKKAVNLSVNCFWWPVRESNPGLRRERPSSWPLDQRASKSRRQDSNLRPLRPERSALPNWATPRYRYCFTSDSVIIAWGSKKSKYFLQKISKSFSDKMEGPAVRGTAGREYEKV